MRRSLSGPLWAFRLATALLAGNLTLGACLADPTAVANATVPITAQVETPLIMDYTPLPTPTLQPTVTLTPLPSPTPIPVKWQTIARGVSESRIPANIPGTDAISIVLAYRLDPQFVEFGVHYDADQPHTIGEWTELIDAALIVNGGFFASSHAPMGRVVINGELFGGPLDYGSDSIGVAGLFAVVDHAPEIYALGRESYSPRGMRFDQAIECYPLLLLPGGQPAFPVETGYIARRTVIGIDEAGFVIILVSDVDLFSLNRLANWLSNSGLRLDTALNLDGGRSTGLGVNIPGHSRLIDSYVPVPIVLAVTLR